MTCNCFFCQQGKDHPDTHAGWGRISSRLLVAESLDPAESIQMVACNTCGHERRADEIRDKDD